MISRTEIIRKQKWEEKQLYGHFKWLTRNTSNMKMWTRLRKGNLKEETESLLIAAQNNAIKTNHTTAKIDKMQQKSRCTLCGDKDETINLISECSKLAQKEYKTRHNWLGKVTIQTNSICTIQNLSWMHKLCWILRHKWIT